MKFLIILFCVLVIAGFFLIYQLLNEMIRQIRQLKKSPNNANLGGLTNVKPTIQHDGLKRVETLLKELYEQNRSLGVSQKGQVSDQQKQMDLMRSIDKKLTEIQSSLVQLDIKLMTTMNTSMSQSAQTIQSTHNRSRFVKPHQAGILTECKECDASYKLTLTSDRDAIFEFCGNIERAIHNYDALLKQYCELEGDRTNFSRFENLSNGQAKLVAQGQWQVKSKQKMKLL